MYKLLTIPFVLIMMAFPPMPATAQTDHGFRFVRVMFSEDRSAGNDWR